MGRTGWVATTHKASPWARQNGRPKGRWKSRAVEKSKNRLSHRAWKSRKVRGIPTFPPPRRLLEINETGHFTCYQKRTSSLANNMCRILHSHFGHASGRGTLPNGALYVTGGVNSVAEVRIALEGLPRLLDPSLKYLLGQIPLRRIRNDCGHAFFRAQPQGNFQRGEHYRSAARPRQHTFPPPKLLHHCKGILVGHADPFTPY